MGTCGWSYDDWVGPFYPKVLPPGRRLEHYLETFPLAEVDSTAYALPSRETVAHWVAALRGAKGRWEAPELTVKVPLALTHDERPRDALAADASAFWTRACGPLAAEGLLGGVLLQYPPWLPEVPAKPDRARAALDSGEAYAPLVARLEAVAPALAGGRLFVELRNRHGLDPDTGEPPGEFLRLLRRLGATLVTVDAPVFPPLFVATSREAYVRFHGRNADIWEEPGSGALDWGAARAPSDGRANRYDYLYGEKELAPWVRRLKEIAARVDTVRVLFNNHAAAKAAVNAREMAQRLGVPAPRRSPGQERLPLGE